MNRVAAIAFALLVPVLSQEARAQAPDPSPVHLAPHEAGEVEAVVAAAIAALRSRMSSLEMARAGRSRSA